MKNRNGFVSNSSSSSFVILATDEMINKSIETLTTFEKAAVNSMIGRGGEEAIVFGQPCRAILGSYCTEDLFCDLGEEYEDDGYDAGIEAWYKFGNLIKKSGGYYNETGY